MEILFRLEEIGSVATRLLPLIKGKVVALHGEMGAGKTTLVHALGEVMGIREVVSSPTFSIINEYGWEGGPVFHIDLYRLKDEEEAIQAGVEDCLYSGATCLVEWPDRAPGLFPPETLHLFLEVVNTQARKLRIAGN
ncbi:MAG: tRNA (adenosine(37)-N6)-threonylcarbamoyltransferase complex ATPase subunit type 1 TsaE [Sphingobacteriales bacterium 12-47-4]|nr:MAG: tRNA (adenosine(37)-N6)-threonylcarbamoyltransferase complex ATPase subunit type 1 TsaE [Sphingobacteriales bacterium 12-47-4]